MTEEFKYDCAWEGDGEGNYDTACSNMFTLIDGTPKDNDFNFCPYCGKPISDTTAKEDKENVE